MNTLSINFSNIYNQNIMSFKDYIYDNSIKMDVLWEDYICNFIYNNIDENMDFLDIGANIGLISISVNNKCKLNKKNINIHCFECDIENFLCLKYNTFNHNNIYIYNIGLADKFKFCNMYTNFYNRGCNSIIKSMDEESKSDHIYTSFDISNEQIVNIN